VGVETLNLESAGLDELEGLLDRCSGFVLGSPTLGGHMPTQVQTALGTIIRNSNAKQVGAPAGQGRGVEAGARAPAGAVWCWC